MSGSVPAASNQALQSYSAVARANVLAALGMELRNDLIHSQRMGQLIGSVYRPQEEPTFYC